MHVNPLLEPNPLGDAQVYLGQRVFGPRVASSSGAAASGGAVAGDSDQVVLAGRAFRGPLNMPLSGVVAGKYGAIGQTPMLIPEVTVDLHGRVIAAAHTNVRIPSGNPTNYLINGGFDWAQRQAPGTLTTITDATYGPDRWKCFRENADLQYNRTVHNGLTSALQCRHFGNFKKITNAGKFMIVQPIEALTTFALRGQAVTLQMKLKASASKTIFIGLIHSGTPDTPDTGLPSGSYVESWNADGTAPTLNTLFSLTYLAAASVPTGASGTNTSPGISCSVTTSWQQFGGNYSLSSDVWNLIAFVLTNADFSVNDELQIAEAQLVFAEAGGTNYKVVPWLPRPAEQELALCQRYYWKTFDFDTAPAQNAGRNGAMQQKAAVTGSVAGAVANPRYPVQMRAAPTITTFNPSAANAQARNENLGTDCTSTASSEVGTGGASFAATTPASTAVQHTISLHATFAAEL